MKIDLNKLTGAGLRNLKASVELLNAIDVIRKFAPEEVPDDDEPMVVKNIPIGAKKVLQLTDGKPKKKMSKAHKAALQKNNKRLQKWMKANKKQCPKCKTMIDPRAIKRHTASCKGVQ